MNRVQYFTIKPPDSLKEFVRFFWVFEINVIKGTPYVYRSMADGCPEIIFHYKGSFKLINENDLINQPLAVVHAQSDKFKRFLTNENFGIFGVYLYPFAIAHLLRMSAYHISSQTPDLRSSFGIEGSELEEKIISASTNQERVKILSLFLEKRLPKSPLKDSAIQHSIKEVLFSNKILSVNNLSDKYNYSLRQFERKFKEYSGFNPKLYSRIIRFHKAMNNYGSLSKSLSEIAYQYGYYDQSHFIHEFKKFSGYHPKKYFLGKTEGIEWRNS